MDLTLPCHSVSQSTTTRPSPRLHFTPTITCNNGIGAKNRNGKSTIIYVTVEILSMIVSVRIIVCYVRCGVTVCKKNNCSPAWNGNDEWGSCVASSLSSNSVERDEVLYEAENTI